MLAIRLARIGRKKQPSYRIIVSEKRYKRNGRYIDKIGFYNPLTTEATVSVDRERFDYWVKMGAQPTPVIQRLVLGIKGTKKRASKKAVEENDVSPKVAPTATEATPEVAASETVATNDGEATSAEEAQVETEEETETETPVEATDKHTEKTSNEKAS